MTELKVLVTRPKEQGERLADHLSSKGFSPILAPMIELTELGEDHLDTQLNSLRRLQDMDAAIAISANAFNFATRILDSEHIVVPKHLDWFAIGEATAERMHLYGLNPILPDSRFDTEGLLALPNFSDINNKKFLLLTGVGGRKKLEDVLRERGASVEKLELYRRTAICHDCLHVCELPDAMIAMSGETLESLRNYLISTDRNHWFEQPLFVSSARIAELALSFGFKEIRLSATASEKSLIEALSRFASEV